MLKFKMVNNYNDEEVVRTRAVLDDSSSVFMMEIEGVVVCSLDLAEGTLHPRALTNWEEEALENVGMKIENHRIKVD